MVESSEDGDVPGLRIPLVAPSLAIGRDASNDLCIPSDEWVSRRHCVLHVVGSTILIEDRSTNGTYVDGKAISGLSPLPVPSALMVGATLLKVLPISPDDSPSDETGSVDSGFHLPGPNGAIGRTEALLLVDIVDSTNLVMRSESAYVELVLGIGRTLEKTQAQEHEPFLKCTGDGFCATFSTAEAALRAADELDTWIQQKSPEVARLVVALHWGVPERLLPGDRTGDAIRVLSAVNRLRRDVPMLRSQLESKRSGTFVLMTEDFRAVTDDAIRIETWAVGRYEVADPETRSEVYCWEPQGKPSGDSRPPRNRSIELGAEPKKGCTAEGNRREAERR